jgi:hypothetical protein
MPLATLPFFGSITAPTLADQASEKSGSGALAMLWLIPILAVGVVVAAGRAALSPDLSHDRRRTFAVTAMALAGTALAGWIGLLIYVQSEISGAGADRAGVSATTFAGAGYWFVLIGFIAAGVGSMMEMSKAKPA